MSILFCRNLDIEVAGSKLLENVTFRLEQGEKVGLIGANGAGKTTLLRVIMGDHPYENGMIDRPETIGYLSQTPMNFQTQGNVFDSMLFERTDILEMRSNLRFLEIKMSQDAEEKTLEQYSNLTEKYERSGGYALEAQVRKILSGLGLESEQSKDISLLSGGQKTRLALGKLLLREPELLILDEPTNHLDIEALEWLENYLGEYAGSVLVVSHDRYFLDRVVSQILFIQSGNLKQYPGNFSEFELQRTVEEKTLARESDRVNKKIASLEEYIRRHGAGIKAKQARGRETQLKKITPVIAPQTTKSLKLNFGSVKRAGNMVMDISDLSIEYGLKPIFENVSMELCRGDRMALLGRNGVGKTSLLRAIIGKVSYKGNIRMGANVSIGYYSQEHENIGFRDNIIDEIRYASNFDDLQIRNLLARFGFYGDEVFKQLDVLSGGEKSRLALCKLFLSQGNLLLLDEPTNHLDMETRELLEDSLEDYDGTILTVSHDRYFLNRIVNKIAILTPQGLQIIEGDYTTYRELMNNENSKIKSDKKLNMIENTAKNYHEESRNNRRKEKKAKQLEEEIVEIESMIKEVETKLESEENSSDYEQILSLHEEFERLKMKLDNLMEEWMAIND